MIIGHMPAGYVVSKLLLPRFAASGVDAKWFLCALEIALVVWAACLWRQEERVKSNAGTQWK